MAKSESKAIPGMIFGGLAFVALAGGAYWTMGRPSQASGGAPQGAFTPAALPIGRLLAVGATVNDARYLVLDDIRRSGRQAEATVLVMGKSTTAIETRFAMMTKRETIDCDQKTIRDEKAGLFDVAGHLGSAKYLSGSTGRAFESADAEGPAVCAATAPRGRVVTGFRAAQHEAQTAPDDLGKLSDANPKDADAAAWLCAAAAHGRWRDTSPQDCDRAVRLAADPTAALVDRAILEVKIGRQGPAAADFQKALAHDPGNPVALFGRSLLLGMRKDKAVSLRDKDQALEVDPNIPGWFQATYGFALPDEYRKHG